MADQITSFADKKIVCLSSGVGIATLVQGLKKYSDNITIIGATSDDGGSGGRLRRHFEMIPPGDFMWCLAALAPENNPHIPELLRYRFPGNRDGKDDELGGQKLGNLMLAAAFQLTGNFTEALSIIQKLINAKGRLFPATTEPIQLSAKMTDGTIIEREYDIDLRDHTDGKKHDRIFITPANPTVPQEAIDAIKEADIIIAGPGDLFTTTLPVLIIPTIHDLLINSTADKLFVLNVANKPGETYQYTALDFIEAIEKHMDSFPFGTVLVNSNTTPPLTESGDWSYVTFSDNFDEKNVSYRIEKADVVNETLTRAHDSDKLASAIVNIYNK